MCQRCRCTMLHIHMHVYIRIYNIQYIRVTVVYMRYLSTYVQTFRRIIPQRSSQVAKWRPVMGLWETHQFFDFSMNIANVMMILGIHHFYSFLDRAKYISISLAKVQPLDVWTCARKQRAAQTGGDGCLWAEARRVQQTWDICEHGGNLGILAGDTSSCSASDSLFFGGLPLLKWEWLRYALWFVPSVSMKIFYLYSIFVLPSGYLT